MTSRIEGDDPEVGFTLIEVLVVLAILGATLGLLLARGPLTSSGLAARDAATQLAQSFRLARARAIAGGRPVSVTVELGGRQILLDGAVATLPGSVTLSAVLANGSVAPGIAVFSFAPDGSAQGGSVLVRSGDRRLAVGVDWLTGKATIDAR